MVPRNSLEQKMCTTMVCDHFIARLAYDSRMIWDNTDERMRKDAAIPPNGIIARRA
jgi:hypothetical protein